MAVFQAAVPKPPVGLLQGQEVLRHPLSILGQESQAPARQRLASLIRPGVAFNS